MSKGQTLAFLLENPTQTIAAIRKGIDTKQVEDFLEENHFPLKETLENLDINATTFFNRKKTKTKLSSDASEKFFRLVSVTLLAIEVLGSHAEALAWLTKEIPSLGRQKPLDLLDTEIGHKLVEEALLQIEHGIYG